MHSDPSELNSLQRKDWSDMYRTTLPSLARKKAAVQKHWPVSLDHCFARIILDNANGIGNGQRPWTEVVKAPAIQNMTNAQLASAIKLGQKIASGKANLVELDETSLAVRGKTKKRKRGDEGSTEDNVGSVNSKLNGKANGGAKVNVHKAEAAKMWSTFHGRAQDGVTGESALANDTEEATHSEDEYDNIDTDDAEAGVDADAESGSQNAIPGTDAALTDARRKIQNSTSLTPFRKHVLTLLTQVPRGQYTTYKAMADAAARLPIPAHFERKSNHTRDSLKPMVGKTARTSSMGSSKTQSKSSVSDKGTKVAPGAARAVGMAMRDNPYAPIVPCHRVLAADGRLGGYKGERDAAGEGRFQQEKRRILREEGVKFDGTGRVVGSPFTAFA